jgi:hypothetical protein
MAKIETAKKLVIDATAAQVSTIQLSLAPGEVRIIIDNDGVAHCARIPPNEAVQLGVAIIQLAAQAAAMAQQQQIQVPQHLNGHG